MVDAGETACRARFILVSPEFASTSSLPLSVYVYAHQASVARSIDLYSARSASKDPTAELTALKKMVEDHMRPRLRSHQKLMLVPGLFGDRQTNRSGTQQEQQDFLVAKLNATVSWAKSDPDVVGIIPCKSHGQFLQILNLAYVGSACVECVANMTPLL